MHPTSYAPRARARLQRLITSLAALTLVGSGLASCGGSDGGGGDNGDGSGGVGQMGMGGGGSQVTRQPVVFAPADEAAVTPLAQVPWPSNAYLTSEGRVDLRGFPRPAHKPGIFERVVETIETETTGFATTGALYVAFGGPIDEAALPQDAAASVADDATVFVVDIDPDSPHRGARMPIRWSARFKEATDYLPANTLAVRLVEGVALRPSTTYALIVTETIGIASEAMTATLAESDPGGATGPFWTAHAPLRAWLADSGDQGGAGVAVAGAAVFTTQDPVSELFAARDFMHTQPVPPLLELDGKGTLQSRFEVFEGVYEAPRFQEGEIPYRLPGTGGAFRFGDGKPIVQGTEQLRFALSTPLKPPPPGGWPIVLYAHGTGGNYRSFITGGVAAVLARNDTAVISIDQIHHGPRSNGVCANGDNSCEQLLFFNFINPVAGRDNVRQSALDYVSLMRFVQTLEIPADENGQGVPITFNGDNVMFMGHSQGGLNGPLFMAVEPEVKGGMLSGAGANFALAIEQKTEPVSIAEPIEILLRLPDSDPLDRWHPVLMLLQTLIEPGDGANYARFWFAERPEGYAPKSVFMTVGLEDTFTPPETTFALATAGRVPLIDPVVQPIEGLPFVGAEEVKFPPYFGNVSGGEASAGLAQYDGEGHFVIFENPSARQRYGRFLNSLARENPPEIF